MYLCVIVLRPDAALHKLLNLRHPYIKTPKQSKFINKASLNTRPCNPK